jgi:hypothetical protein
MKTPWSPEEDAALSEAACKGVSLARLTVRFRRPKAGIRTRLRLLGVKQPALNRLPVADRV